MPYRKGKVTALTVTFRIADGTHDIRSRVMQPEHQAQGEQTQLETGARGQRAHDERYDPAPGFQTIRTATTTTATPMEMPTIRCPLPSLRTSGWSIPPVVSRATIFFWVGTW